MLLCGDCMEEYDAVVRYQALQAFGVSVDAVCPGKKSGDICPTAIHQHSTSQFSPGQSTSSVLRPLLLLIHLFGRKKLSVSFPALLGKQLARITMYFCNFTLNATFDDTDFKNYDGLVISGW